MLISISEFPFGRSKKKIENSKKIEIAPVHESPINAFHFNIRRSAEPSLARVGGFTSRVGPSLVLDIINSRSYGSIYIYKHNIICTHSANVKLWETEV